MALSVIYVARDGVPIDKATWEAKQADPSYTIVRQYDNAVVRLTLKWVGKVANPQNSFPDYWPVFILLVQNYKPDGTLVNDPVDGDKTYATEADAVAAYEKFLLRWTESSMDEEGKFVEVDNTLTPPPPPDPNKPTTESTELDEGAW